MSLENELKQLAKQWPELSPPTGHEKRFAKRLRKRKSSFQPYWSAAAVVLLLMGLGIAQWSPKPSNELEVSTAFYTQAIQSRLGDLEENIPAVHAKSLADVKVQLNILHQDYLLLQTQWEEDSNHPLLLKALINNLQQQLNLLQALEKNINAVEKNDYENVF